MICTETKYLTFQNGVEVESIIETVRRDAINRACLRNQIYPISDGEPEFDYDKLLKFPINRGFINPAMDGGLSAKDMGFSGRDESETVQLTRLMPFLMVEGKININMDYIQQVRVVFSCAPRNEHVNEITSSEITTLMDGKRMLTVVTRVDTNDYGCGFYYRSEQDKDLKL